MDTNLLDVKWNWEATTREQNGEERTFSVGFLTESEAWGTTLQICYESGSEIINLIIKEDKK